MASVGHETVQDRGAGRDNKYHGRVIEEYVCRKWDLYYNNEYIIKNARELKLEIN